MKRLTVIIPGFNTPDSWWRRCVMSVLAAIGPEDEVVCVDDGSVVKPCLDDIAREDTRIRVVWRSENGGLSTARNAGLDMAQGEYVAFVDSDDEVRPDIFRKSIEMLEDTISDICVYGVDVVWVKEGLAKRDLPDCHAYGLLSACDLADLRRRCLFNYVCNKVYRRAFLNEHRLRFDPNGMPCEDVVFNLGCVMAGARWCSVGGVGYVYYRVSGVRSILSGYRPTNYNGMGLCVEAWRRYCTTLSPNDAGLFDECTQFPKAQLLKMEWRNIWAHGTPYTLRERWRWLQNHSELGRGAFFVKTVVFVFLRRYFYVCFVRRWRIRCRYPHARSI